MQILDFLSVSIIPIIMFYIILNGVMSKRPVFEDFTMGAKEGLQIVIDIAPTIIGLLVAVGVMRTSGALELISNIFSPLADFVHIPSQLIPLSVVKMFSASGANGLLFDIFKEYGTDSLVGFAASILLSCTETLFYTLSLYFMSVGIKNARWTVPVGILLAVISLFVSVWIAKLVVGV